MKKINKPLLVVMSLVALVYLLITMLGLTEETTHAFNRLRQVAEGPIAIIENLISEEVQVGLNQTVERPTYKATVERVVDGDTLVARLDGKSIRVRFTGVDTPESVGAYKNHPEPYGLEASAYTKSLLEGASVWLEEDLKLMDPYDRYLFYVWLEDPSTTTLLEGCVNAMLLAEGYGTWFDDRDNQAYAEEFEAFERKAELKGLGLWQGE